MYSIPLYEHTVVLKNKLICCFHFETIDHGEEHS